MSIAFKSKLTQATALETHGGAKISQKELLQALTAVRTADEAARKEVASALEGDVFQSSASRGARALAAALLPWIAKDGAVTPQRPEPKPEPQQPDAPAPAARQYTVRPGDTLSGIAERFGTSVRALAARNGISDPDLISVGQRLEIAGGREPAAPVFHTVRPGDTLSEIAERYGTSTRAIANANGISNPNLISVGQRLRIPGGQDGGPVVRPDEPTPETRLQRNVRKAMDYAQGLVGAPYAWWTEQSGPLGEGAPAWASDGPPPDHNAVFRNGVFCAGVANLMLRAAGKGDEIPRNWPYDGGTRAYYNKYYDVAEWFDPNKKYPEGTLLIRNYRDPVDQGHVAIVQGNGKVLQSFPGAGGVNGVSNSVTLHDSNWMGDGTNYYELAVLPKDWLG